MGVWVSHPHTHTPYTHTVLARRLHLHHVARRGDPVPVIGAQPEVIRRVGTELGKLDGLGVRGRRGRLVERVAGAAYLDNEAILVRAPVAPLEHARGLA